MIVHLTFTHFQLQTGVTLDWLLYDIPTEGRTIKLSTLRETLTSVSLSAPVRIVRRSPCDARLLAACIDGSLHVVHHIAGLTHSVRAGFVSTFSLIACF